ncbi:DEKNAAC103488 [Brettanomyces naardenensis]|uniref:DEKNAAC103488 n=1 Tax=Brettanomyces naardenensis TaxID=13370 RepID=A0A448YMY5_BRENA|nr:DEKNAAC103488 [Brettanomyces naardenensis]
MVSKLKFKGTKSPKRIHHHHSPRKEVNSFYINNQVIPLTQIDTDIFTKSTWTTAVGPVDLKDSTPIILALQRDSKVGLLTVTNDEKVIVSTESSLEIKPEAETVSFSPAIDRSAKVQRVEPTLANQALIAMDIGHLMKMKDLQGSRYLALKDYHSKKYLSHDPETHELGLSKVLTDNEMFKFTYDAKGTSNFRISVGKKSDKMKLIVTDDFQIRVIEDVDELLSDLNTFNIRVQIANSAVATDIIEKINKKDVNDDDEEVSIAVKELAKQGIKVNNKTLRTIRKAVREKRVNEVIVKIKERHRTSY